MKGFYHLFFHELRCMFLSAHTYVASTLFLLFMGFVYLFILNDFTHNPHESLLSTEFYQSFWLATFFLIPLLTMKSIAEDKRMGTLESLLSTPVTPLAITIAKFASCYIFYIGIWALTLFFGKLGGFVVTSLTQEEALSSTASNIGGLSFVALSGILFIAIGIFCSALTRSQLVSGILCFSLLFVLIVGLPLVANAPFLDLPYLAFIKLPMNYVDIFAHLDDFSRGILDSRPFVFYFSASTLLLLLTSYIIKSRA